MFDFAKTKINCTSINKLINNSYLNFYSPANIQTGEIINEKKAAYSGLEFIIKNDQYVNLKGSFHKYMNEGLHNHNDFALNDFVEVLIDLSKKFELNPFTTTLHNLEFGVNVTLPFGVNKFLNSILSFKGKEYDKDTYSGKGNLLRFSFDHYDLKIYNKSLQFNLTSNVLRFEISVKKMVYFKNIGIDISKLSDLLNSTNFDKLKKQLLKAFSELLIYDNSIDTTTLPKIDKKILINGSNPKYWIEEKEKNKENFKKKRERFRLLILKHGKQNLQEIVHDLINSKWNSLTSIDTSTEQKINKYLNQFSIKRFPELTTIKEKHLSTNIPRINYSNIRLKEGVPKVQGVRPEVRKILSENWSVEIIELELFFSKSILPCSPVKLNSCSSISNIPQFINSHFECVKANKGNNTFLPFLNRLECLKEILSTN